MCILDKFQTRNLDHRNRFYVCSFCNYVLMGKIFFKFSAFFCHALKVQGYFKSENEPLQYSLRKFVSFGIYLNDGTTVIDSTKRIENVCVSRDNFDN